MDIKKKEKILKELADAIAKAVQDLAEKHDDVDFYNEMYFSYIFGLWDGEDQDAFVTESHVNDINELRYCLDMIEDAYQEESIDNLFNGISLN